MDVLFITSATYKLPAEKLRNEPLAGAVFASHPGVSGPPDARFAG
jgi:hypothetical protein